MCAIHCSPSGRVGTGVKSVSAAVAPEQNETTRARTTAGARKTFSTMSLVLLVGVDLLVAMGIDFEDGSPRVLAVGHPVRSVRKQRPDLTPLLAPGRHDLLGQPFDVRIGHAKVEDSGPPILEVVLPPHGPCPVELEHFETDAVHGGEVRDADALETLAEDVGAEPSDQ